MEMTDTKNDKPDKAGRRFEPDRRIFSYTFHIPEQRSNEERRRVFDRRSRGEKSSTSRFGFSPSSAVLNVTSSHI